VFLILCFFTALIYARLLVCTLYLSNVFLLMLFRSNSPNFNCATLIMGERQFDMLQRAQNRTMRIILHIDKYTKIEHMLQVLQFMSVQQVLHYNVYIFVINNILPILLRIKVEIILEARTRDTRGS